MVILKFFSKYFLIIYLFLQHVQVNVINGEANETKFKINNIKIYIWKYKNILE